MSPTQEKETLLVWNKETRYYQGTVGNNLVEVDGEAWTQTVAALTATYIHQGMTELAARNRAERELSQPQAWMNPQCEGVKVKGLPYAEWEKVVKEGWATMQQAVMILSSNSGRPISAANARGLNRYGVKIHLVPGRGRGGMRRMYRYKDLKDRVITKHDVPLFSEEDSQEVRTRYKQSLERIAELEKQVVELEASQERSTHAEAETP